MHTVEPIDECKFYKHVPLSPGRTIRLISLQPAKRFADDIKCNLQEYSLEPLLQQAADSTNLSDGYAKHSPYEALSYVWGGTIGHSAITCDGKTLNVTLNCMSALRHLRRKSKPRLLWIDAICIDQLSASEKVHQLKLMGLVYTAAKRVVIWLGESGPGTEKIVRRMRWNCRFCGLADKSRRRRSYEFALRVVSFLTTGNLCSTPKRFVDDFPFAWFQRVWTLQEVLLGSHPIVLWGFTSIPWSYFETLYSRWDLGSSIYSTVVAQTLVRSISDWHATDSSWRRAMSFESSERPTSPATNNALKWLTIDGILHIFKAAYTRASSNPRDKVHGLCGILQALQVSLPEPDYEAPVSKVYEDFIFSLLSSTNSVFILTYIPLRFNVPGWPSWVPDLREGEQIKQPGQEINWDLSDRDVTFFRNGFYLRGTPGKLILEGVILSTLSRVGTTCSPPGASNSLVGKMAHDVSMILWTGKLIGLLRSSNTLPNGRNALHALSEMLHKDFEDTEDALDLHDLSRGLDHDYEMLKTAYNQAKQISEPHWEQLNPDLMLYGKLHTAEYASRLQRLNRFAPLCRRGVGASPIVLANGCVGLAGPHCLPQEGDAAVLFYGAARPAIIRQFDDGYQMIGTADIAGISEDVWPLKVINNHGEFQEFTLV